MGGRLSCVLGGTKSLSTNTRRVVRRSAVGEHAHPQQTPLKLHDETWAGLLRDQGLRFSHGGGNRAGVCCCGGLSFMS